MPAAFMSTLCDKVGGKERIIGGPFGSNLAQADYAPLGVPVIRGTNMEFNGRFIGGEFAFVSEQKASRLSSNAAHPGDIIVTQRGTLGQVSIVPKGLYNRYVISQSQMSISPDPTLCDPLSSTISLSPPHFGAMPSLG